MWQRYSFIFICANILGIIFVFLDYFFNFVAFCSFMFTCLHVNMFANWSFFMIVLCFYMVLIFS